MRHFRSDVEARIDAFRASQGGVMFGGRMIRDVDPTLAIPDNLGANLVEPGDRV